MKRSRISYALVLLTLCIGLQAWATGPDPETRDADDWDFAGLGSDFGAFFMQETPKWKPSGSCESYPKPYEAHVHLSSGASTVIGFVERDYLFHFMGHGVPGLVGCDFGTYIYHSSCGGCTLCLTNPSLLQADWEKCRIAVWLACYSAATGAHGNIAQGCGANASLGFREKIGVDEGQNENLQAIADFSDYLWEALCLGRRPSITDPVDCAPVGLLAAANYAGSMILLTYGGEDYGLDTGTVYGDPYQKAIPWD